MIARLLACAAVIACLMPARADADITIGLYAPTAPFEGSGDRVSFINAVAEHLSAKTGVKVSGKVYGTAGAFAAAARKGEIQFAVVDAPYAAAQGLPYDILAAATRSGAATAGWQLIAKSSIGHIRDLRRAKVALPTVGAKAQAFVGNALLGGEVDANYFGSLVEAADARSAVTMIMVSKADAAFVPAGIEPPAGTKRVTMLTSVGWPMFVALQSAEAKHVSAFSARIKTFSGTGTFSGFTDAGAGNYRSLASSFGRVNKRGPMALPPPARLSARDLLAGCTFTVPLSNPIELVAAPPKP